MEELENEGVNHELCALAVEDMFESWSPETQEQVLAEWNDWQQGHHCVECGKVFTRPDCLKRHVRRFHTGEKPFVCQIFQKCFAKPDVLKRHEKVYQEKSFECQRCHKKFNRKVWDSND